MFLSAQFDVTKFWPQKNESALEYWVSFSPMAPVFGVKWRFGDIGEMPPKRGRAKAKRATSSARIKADVQDADVVPTAKPATKPAPEPAVAKAAPKPAATPKPASDKAAEPVKKAEAAPKPAAEAKPAAPAKPDDLTVIKGIGPKMAEKLNAKGITNFSQIAGWTKAKVAKMDAELGGIPGAIERSDWVGQAKTLSNGAA